MTELLTDYPWVLPLAIFLSRLLDVTLATLRAVFVAKGARNIAPVFGFFEVLIWISIIGQVFALANDFWSYLSYAAGYAVGTYLGLTIESKIGFGFVRLRIFTEKPGRNLVLMLHHENFGATATAGQGAVSAINMVETVVRRTCAAKVEALFHDYDANAFYTIEDVRSKHRGIFVRNFSFSPVPFKQKEALSQ